MHRFFAFFGALALIGVTGPAHADPVRILAEPAPPKPGSKEAKRLAKQHFQDALKFYKDGSYRQAIDELTQAIEYDPGGKDLYYNLGLVHEKLGEIDPAIAAFKRYTEMETDTAELERVIQTIRRLEGARDQVAKTDTPETTEPSGPQTAAMLVVERDKKESPRDEKKKKGRLDAWVYATGGASLVALGVGTYYGVRALSTRPSSSETTGKGNTIYDLQDRADRAHNYAVTADIAIGVGLGLGGVAALLYFIRDAPPEKKPAVGAFIGPKSAELTVGGSF